VTDCGQAFVLGYNASPREGTKIAVLAQSRSAGVDSIRQPPKISHGHFLIPHYDFRPWYLRESAPLSPPARTATLSPSSSYLDSEYLYCHPYEFGVSAEANTVASLPRSRPRSGPHCRPHVCLQHSKKRQRRKIEAKTPTPTALHISAATTHLSPKANLAVMSVSGIVEHHPPPK
jgi:hypothetical protein